MEFRGIILIFQNNNYIVHWILDVDLSDCLNERVLCVMHVRGRGQVKSNMHTKKKYRQD